MKGGLARSELFRMLFQCLPKVSRAPLQSLLPASTFANDKQPDVSTAAGAGRTEYLCWSEWIRRSQAAAETESTLPPGVAAGVCSTSLDDRLRPVYSRGGGMASLVPELRAHCRISPASASHSALALADVPPVCSRSEFQIQPAQRVLTIPNRHRFACHACKH